MMIKERVAFFEEPAKLSAPPLRFGIRAVGASWPIICGFAIDALDQIADGSTYILGMYTAGEYYHPSGVTDELKPSDFTDYLRWRRWVSTQEASQPKRARDPMIDYYARIMEQYDPDEVEQGLLEFIELYYRSQDPDQR